MIYKTFEEWKAGQWLEDGEPRTKAYTEDELLLVEMGWKYGFDACKEELDCALDYIKQYQFELFGKYQDALLELKFGKAQEK